MAPDLKTSHTLLPSQEHEGLLNIIDELRSWGISHYVDLPQVIVCGDQSSGKSSVLEAVSGIQFPRKDNLCTRFATEVILRRSQTTSASVSIVPDSSRSDDEKRNLLDFKHHREDIRLEEFEILIDKAKLHMGLDDGGRNFSNDILRVEISGPEQPHLTLVDLPGLFSAGNKSQSDEDANAVKSLVLSYMRKRRSIILAVVSAKNDFANQIVTKYARELDPDGSRTLGIITKPDTLFAGSDSERAFLDLAENKDVHFRLGWHVVRNRDFDTRTISTEERDQREKDFFSQGVWATLPRSQVGISALKPRLSTLLRDQILAELPSLTEDVERGIQDCNQIVGQLGESRATLPEQRLYLLRASQNFSSLAKSAIDGNYNDPFFESPATQKGYSQRLRAVVQNVLLDFAQTMRQEGHAKHIVEGQVSERQRKSKPRSVSRETYVDEVLSLMKRSRGCELPGTYNPQIIGDLFYDQSKPWKSFVDLYMDQIWSATSTTLEIILAYSTDDGTASGLKRHILQPEMERLRRDIDEKAAAVLEPHQRGHPITYNHYFTDNVQKLKEAHRRKYISKRLDAFFGTNIDAGNTYCEERTFDVKQLLNSMTEETIADMDRYACSEAIDYMKAYYKVAMKNLVDAIGALVIEKCLLQKLPHLLSPDVVVSLDDTTVADVAAETEKSREERMQTSERLRVLKNALGALRALGQLQPQNAEKSAESHFLTDSESANDEVESMADGLEARSPVPVTEDELSGYPSKITPDTDECYESQPPQASPCVEYSFVDDSAPVATTSKKSKKRHHVVKSGW